MPTRRKKTKPAASDAAQIRTLIDNWARAVRNADRPAIRANHAATMLMFDVPPPFLSRGIDAYMKTWETFLSWAGKPAAFNLRDVKITAGKEVSFATATGVCTGPDAFGKPEPLEFRLTIGLRKVARRWVITHEHHSLPSE
jgi:ketosteroid isomerase-like protein